MAFTIDIIGGTPLTTELVASGFSKPVYLTSPPNDSSRLFVMEQHSGLIAKSMWATPFFLLALFSGAVKVHYVGIAGEIIQS